MSDITPLFERFGRTFDAGVVIFEEGDSATEMFIIQSGSVKVIKHVHSSEHVLAELGKGDFFGEMAIVINDKRFATAIAITKVELLAFTNDDLANLITKNPKVAFNIIEKLCRRLQNANLNIKYLLNIGKVGLTALVLLDSFACEEGSVGIPLARVREELIRKLKVPQNLISHYLDFFATDHSIDIRDDALFIGNRAKLEKHVENAFLQD